MDFKRKEINHEINMRYRQLGKRLFFDDLKNDRLRVSKYKNYAKQIDELIGTLVRLDVEMDNIEEDKHATSDESNLEEVKTVDGITMYKFCSSCNAGNHPEATVCIRCEARLD